MRAASTQQFDSYALSAAAMTAADVPALHALSVAVGWPHRPEDWAMLIDVGAGLAVRDEIGRVVASALSIPYGDHFAAIGMVITSPRLHGHGAGRWLMGRMLDHLAGRGVVLHATRVAYRLYLSLGFQPIGPVHQHNGIAQATPNPGLARPLLATDHAAIHALDTAALGAPRRQVMERLLRDSEGTILERNGAVHGYALRRPFGRGQEIGPIVAETDEDAIALVTPLLQPGQFQRVDTRAGDGPFRTFLEEAGLAHRDTVTRMELGASLQGKGCYGLASQALG